MAKREEFKIVNLAGRKWRVEKFDALTGSYIAFQIMSKIMPMGLDPKLGVDLPEGRSMMSKSEFAALQKDCLSVVYELVDANGTEMPVKLMLDNGVWGVDGLQKDMITVMSLTITALVFNIASFFEGDALKELTQTFADMSLPGVQTLMNMPTPQL